MKRFYKTVDVGTSEEGFIVLLDGKPVKTKSGKMLCAPCRGIADAAAKEWHAQDEMIIPDTMPITQILYTKIDRVSVERAAMGAAIKKYLDTDLICYLTQEPEDLQKAQNDAWARWRSWFSDRCGEMIHITQGLEALRQPPSAHHYLDQQKNDMDDDMFTIFQIVTSLSGSVILALCFVKKDAGAQDIMNACFVEEDYKDKIYHASLYGPDPMIEKRKQSMRRDLDALVFYRDEIAKDKA